LAVCVWAVAIVPNRHNKKAMDNFFIPVKIKKEPLIK
jgi:hypothetical protein